MFTFEYIMQDGITYALLSKHCFTVAAPATYTSLKVYPLWQALHEYFKVTASYE
jgi:hypothetical protein